MGGLSPPRFATPRLCWPSCACTRHPKRWPVSGPHARSQPRGTSRRCASRDRASTSIRFRLHWSTSSERRERVGTDTPPSLASGDNACILHYTENDRRIGNDDLVLIDAGAEYAYFSADITRTFPADGTFSGPQRDLYEVVLSAQHAAMASAEPGSTMKELHRVAVESIAGGLVDLGLLPGSAEDAVRMHHYREYFMPRYGALAGHGCARRRRLRDRRRSPSLGARHGVHYRAGYPMWIPSVKLSSCPCSSTTSTSGPSVGCCWARPRQRKWRRESARLPRRLPTGFPPAFRGIGIRIEDDILITENGHDNLTAGVPTDREQIEALCAEAPLLPFLETR